MTHKQIFIGMLIFTLLIIYLIPKCSCNNSNDFENFELNPNYSVLANCDNQPLNSNCFCEPDKTKQKILGDFPMNYGQTSPYVYTCVDKNTLEPKTTLYV